MSIDTEMFHKCWMPVFINLILEESHDFRRRRAVVLKKKNGFSFGESELEGTWRAEKCFLRTDFAVVVFDKVKQLLSRGFLNFFKTIFTNSKTS